MSGIGSRTDQVCFGDDTRPIPVGTHFVCLRLVGLFRDAAMVAKCDDSSVVSPAVASVEVDSASGIAPRAAFEQWEAFATDALLPITLEPVDPSRRFHGRITAMQFDRFAMSYSHTSAQHAFRTRRQVAQAEADLLLANIVFAGGNRLEQAGRVTETVAGSIAFCDSGRPIDSRCVDDTVSLTIRAPMDLVLEHSGLTRDELPIVTAMPIAGAMGVVVGFFRALAELSPEEADHAAAVVGSEGAAMLGSALLLAAGRNTVAQSDSLYTRRQVLTYMRRRFTDPDLTVDEIAHACLLSRRSLYRVCEGFGGPAAMVRRMRIEHARKLLRQQHGRSVAAIAAACGFTTERNFYRVFREETGLAPDEFRARWKSDPALLRRHHLRIEMDGGHLAMGG